MKKPIVIGTIVIIAIIAGLSSTVFTSNNNSDKIILNDVDPSTDNTETIMVTTTTNVVTDLVENIGENMCLSQD